MCKSQGKCCKLIIDNGSIDNLVSTEVIDKLNLKKTKHHVPYKVSWFQKGNQLLVNEQCEIELQIWEYKDKLICDVIPMQVCCILLGRPWKYDMNENHDGRKNVYELEKDGVKHKIMLLQEEDSGGKDNPKTLLLSGKEFL